MEVEEDVLVPDEELAAACQVGEEEGRELLLMLVLERTPPLWLLTAGGDGTKLRNELVPDHAQAALATTIADPDRREAFLLARARTVDAAGRRLIGALGEVAVVEACVTELIELGAPKQAEDVQRVSLISDELGYDVTAPRVDGGTRRLEVKSTRSSSQGVRIFISRTEATVGVSDPAWSLVIVRIAPDDSASIVGWTKGTHLADLLPVDEGDGRWETASISVQADALRPGIPPAG